MITVTLITAQSAFAGHRSAPVHVHGHRSGHKEEAGNPLPTRFYPTRWILGHTQEFPVSGYTNQRHPVFGFPSGNRHNTPGRQGHRLPHLSLPSEELTDLITLNNQGRQPFSGTALAVLNLHSHNPPPISHIQQRIWMYFSKLKSCAKRERMSHS